MKKIISVFLCTLMVIFLFLPASAAPYSYSNEYCTHSYTSIYENGKVEETCTTETYIYEKFCNNCGKKLEGGTIVRQKNSPSHTYTWVSIGCANGQHSYESRCTRCGFIVESMTLKCYGNCIEFQSIKTLLDQMKRR